MYVPCVYPLALVPVLPEPSVPLWLRAEEPGPRFQEQLNLSQPWAALPWAHSACFLTLPTLASAWTTLLSISACLCSFSAFPLGTGCW